MQTLSPIRLLDFVADALDFRSSNLNAMATATLNYEPMVFTPKQGDEAPTVLEDRHQEIGKHECRALGCPKVS